MSVKVKCWAGCRARIIHGANLNKIVMVIQAARPPKELLTLPGFWWEAVSLGGTINVTNLAGLDKGRAMNFFIRDQHLDPLPDIKADAISEDVKARLEI